MEANRLTKSIDDENIINAEIAASNASEIDVSQLVSFMIDQSEYAVSILAVNEILRYPEITRLPNTPDFISGVINLRGNVIPVVDVRVRFGFSKGNITDLTRVIVVDTEGKQIGLLVDNVYQVVRIPAENMDPPSEIISNVYDEFVSGIGRFNGRLIIALKMSHSIFLEDKWETDRAAFINSDNQRME